MKENPITFYPGLAPTHLRTTSFLLRPLRATDNILDYAAMCDRWETQAWIAAGNEFTPQINLTALLRHEQEHVTRQAFTFIILNPAETHSLGCLYLAPLLPLLQKGDAENSLHEEYTAQDAAVRFWLRDTFFEEYCTPLLRALLVWLAASWSFPHLLFHTNPQDTRQRSLFEANAFQLRFLFDLNYGAFYQPPPSFTHES